MGPITKIGFLKGAALATFGTAALGAGSAFAAPSACVAGVLGSLPNSCTFNNWLVTITNQTVTTGGVFNVGFSDLDADFNPHNALNIGISSAANSNSPTVKVGSLSYTLSFNDPTIGQYLTSAQLVSSRNPITAGSYGTLTGDFGVAFTADGGPLAIPSGPFSGNFTSGVTANGSYQAIFASDVPVPLPILGAGLAFGFTRKLRKRAKSLA